MWDRPLRDHEIRVLRKSKVQQHTHKQRKVERHQDKTNGESSMTVKKSNHLKTLLTSKKAYKESTTSDKISHAAANGKKINNEKSDLSSKSSKKMEIKPVKAMYSGDDADILEGDDEEDNPIPYSRG